MKQVRLQLESKAKELTSYMESLHKEVMNFVQQRKKEKQKLFEDVQHCLKFQDHYD